MPRPVTGRRPDSLFDNRYRYDFIYPRGRSGETLRAYDTQANDTPVVIKRPAPQDAPPIRAGQEQSILREKRALELLTGHPVLTELRHSGTFRVSGQLHQYIVMDMAQGDTIESIVLGLAERGERQTELEMLVILDHFLDLLQAAHDKNILYNDVDAKHLFWDRTHYRLKVIDWGNAIFLDTDHAPHASRATDIQQVGQLLYFWLSGGRRLELGRAEAALDLPETVTARLKDITARAAHLDATNRYTSIASIRQDLAEVRRPLEKNRDLITERARTRLGGAATQGQLEEVRSLLQEALTADPGHPAAKDLLIEVEMRLNALALQADLDAVRIYIESNNLGRATLLLGELQAKAGGDQPILSYLRDLCEHLRDAPVGYPAGLTPALESLFKNDAGAAGRALVVTPEPRPEARLLQAKLAQRLTQFMPGVVLLRPHLIMLEDDLSRQPNTLDPLRALQLLIFRVDDKPAPGIQPLVLHYGRLSEGLAVLSGKLANQPAALSLLNAARRAADDITDLLDVVSLNALSDTSRAGNALWHAAAIDPGSAAFRSVDEALGAFHQELETMRRVVPQSDGSNIRDYLLGAQSRLGQYAAEISDPQFQSILRSVDDTIRHWSQAIDFVALGGRRPAAESSRKAGEAITVLNEAVAYWFEENARKIEEANRIEYLSPNVTLGRALADGWDAWDKGRGGEAQAAGERALQAAGTDGETLAAQRLIDLGDALSAWLTSDGSASAERTKRTLTRVIGLLLPDEDQIRRKFNDQMPRMDTYLKAMTRGLVDPMRDASAAAIRVLFFDNVLRGILAQGDEQFEEADFWREAATRSFSGAKTHPAYQALDTAITRRHLILDAVRAINNTRSPAQLVELRQAVRTPLAAAQLDSADQAVRSLDEALKKWPDGDFRVAKQHLDLAVERITAAEATLGKDLSMFKAWLGDLAASTEALTQARRTIEQAAMVPSDQPDPQVAEALRRMLEITRRDLGEAYTAQLRQWRDTYTAVANIYADDALTKDEKLRLFESHFSAMFVDRQPALPIMKHWHALIRALPDDPEPLAPHLEVAAEGQPMTAEYEYATDSQTGAEPAFVEEIDIETPPTPIREASSRRGEGRRAASRQTAIYTRGAEPPTVEIPDQEPQYVPFERKSDAASGIAPRLMIVGAIGVAALVIGTIFFLLRSRDNGGRLEVTLTVERGVGVATTPSPEATVVVPTMTLEPSSTPMLPTNTLPPSETPTPRPTDTLTLTATETPTPAPTQESFVPTPTVPITPSLTPVPSDTPVVSPTPPPSATPTPLSGGVLIGSPVPTNPGIVPPTALPEALPGEYDLLKLLTTLPAADITWDTEWFAPGSKGWQLGNPDTRRGSAPVIKLGTDILTGLIGTDAPSYLKRVDATLELTQYSPLLLQTGQVYFGVGLETARPPRQRADARARLAQENLLDLGPAYNGSFRRATQIPVTTVAVQLSVERNADRTISLYVNGQLLGTSDDVFALGSPLVVYLYTGSGGVIVNVTDLKVRIER
jgi:tetratricopeptide (TPR) repeat protein